MKCIQILNKLYLNYLFLCMFCMFLCMWIFNVSPHFPSIFMTFGKKILYYLWYSLLFLKMQQKNTLQHMYFFKFWPKSLLKGIVMNTVIFFHYHISIPGYIYGLFRGCFLCFVKNMILWATLLHSYQMHNYLILGCRQVLQLLASLPIEHYCI